MTQTDPSPPSATSSENRQPRVVVWIGRTTALLVGLLAIAAFALSFEALRDLAIVSGAIPNPKRAWLFPVLLDGGVVVFSLAALRASLTGGDRKWFMTLVVMVTLLSVAFNVAHATRGILSAIMAGMPPLLLFLAFESLMRQVQDSLQLPAKKRTTPRLAAAPRPKVSLAPTEDRKARVHSLRLDPHQNRKGAGNVACYGKALPAGNPESIGDLIGGLNR
jgi:hypothetical protein